jgi:hypothetical protein
MSVFFEADVGDGSDFGNSIKNAGFSGSFVYFLIPNIDFRSFARKSKIRLDASIMTVNLQN